MKRTKLGLVGFAVLGTIIVGPHLTGARDAAASNGAAGTVTTDGSEGPPPSAGAAAVLAPAFVADDVLGAPEVDGAQITASIATAGKGKVADGDKIARGDCPTGMVEVEGDYCPNVEQKCLRWLDPETKMRCAEFDKSSACEGKTRHKKFCIDEYEYPNQVGEKPVIMKTWYEAQNTCKSEGKRLCGESEWTLSCEGAEHLPYPYGYTRDAQACNIDKPHPDVNEAAIANPATREKEVERLWQGEVSGSREACVSPYGVHDMTGNVDEWVVNESGKPYKSGLKGGYWGPVRDRCRPMTVAHNETFIFYQIGFRCCGDVPGESTAPTPKGLVGKTTHQTAPVPAAGAQSGVGTSS
jgi:sulfatase modifying factor 1